MSCLLHMRGWLQEQLECPQKTSVPGLRHGQWDDNSELEDYAGAEKVKEARLSPQHINSHSLCIGGAILYENALNGGSITAGFLGLWAFGGRWACIYIYIYAVIPGPVEAYA